MLKDIKEVIQRPGATFLQDLAGAAALCLMLATVLLLPGSV